HHFGEKAVRSHYPFSRAIRPGEGGNVGHVLGRVEGVQPLVNPVKATVSLSRRNVLDPGHGWAPTVSCSSHRRNDDGGTQEVGLRQLVRSPIATTAGHCRGLPSFLLSSENLVPSRVFLRLEVVQHTTSFLSVLVQDRRRTAQDKLGAVQAVIGNVGHLQSV